MQSANTHSTELALVTVTQMTKIIAVQRNAVVSAREELHGAVVVASDGQQRVNSVF